MDGLPQYFSFVLPLSKIQFLLNPLFFGYWEPCLLHYYPPDCAWVWCGCGLESFFCIVWRSHGCCRFFRSISLLTPVILFLFRSLCIQRNERWCCGFWWFCGDSLVWNTSSVPLSRVQTLAISSSGRVGHFMETARHI
jgi:hypothetical protein